MQQTRHARAHGAQRCPSRGREAVSGQVGSEGERGSFGTPLSASPSLALACPLGSFAPQRPASLPARDGTVGLNTGLRFEKSADPCAAHERSGVRQPDRRRAHREDAVAATGWWLRRRAAGWHVRAFSDTEVRIQVGSRCGSKAVRPEDIRSPTTAGDYTPRLHDARRARCDEAADRATAKSPKRQRSKRQRLKRRERDAEFQSARARPVDK